MEIGQIVIDSSYARAPDSKDTIFGPMDAENTAYYPLTPESEDWKNIAYHNQQSKRRFAFAASVIYVSCLNLFGSLIEWSALSDNKARLIRTIIAILVIFVPLMFYLVEQHTIIPETNYEIDIYISGDRFASRKKIRNYNWREPYIRFCRYIYDHKYYVVAWCLAAGSITLIPILLIIYV